MARTVAQIQQTILDAITANPDLTYVDENNITHPLTDNTSARAIFRAFTFIYATAAAFLEQLMDLYVLTIEGIVARSPGASILWVQDKMFKFQYDATNPQIVQLINTIPQYPTVDATKRIITACSVTSNVANTVNIKVAKSNPYTALSGPELSAAQSYIDTIGVAGIDYNVISLAADKLYIQADVYYQGQYSAVIQTNVIAAINTYLQQLSLVNFNGDLKMSDLTDIIRDVVGVNDIVAKNIRGRADATPFANSAYFIQNNAVVNRLFSPAAGYIVEETTVGQTFADSLNFIPQ